MNTNEKLERLAELDEDGLRKEVIIPLLTRMGFRAVVLYHGSGERGKDIICFDYDKLGNKEYLAVVAKTHALDGAAGSRKSLQEVMNQVEQCFDVPYDDLFGMKEVTMHKVWVITPKKIVSGAQETVFEKLKKSNLAKLVRFIPGSNLIQLLDEHYPAFWDENLAPIDELREQNKRLRTFLKRLLKNLGAKADRIEEVVEAATNSDFPPRINALADRNLSDISAYRIEFDSIDEEYQHDFFTEGGGIIKETLFEAKQKIYHAMFRVDEIIENYNRIIELTDPTEFVDQFNSDLAQEFPFWNAMSGDASDALANVESLEQGLEELKELETRLEEMDKLEWARALADSVKDNTQELEKYLDGIDQEELVLHWMIEGDESKGKLVVQFTKSEGLCIETKHRRMKTEYRRFADNIERPQTAEEIIGETQWALWQYLQKLAKE